MDDPLDIPRGPLDGPHNESQEQESDGAPPQDAQSFSEPSVELVSNPPAEWTAVHRGASNAEESRKRNLRHNLLLLLSLTLAAFALSAWILVRVNSPFGSSSSGPQELVRAQLRAVDRGQFRPAYDMFSERYRQQVSFDLWHELIVTHWRMFHGEVLRSGALAQTGPGVTLEIHVRSSDERQYRARFTLIRTGMGSGEGRANRPRSRHCNRRNAVSQDTLPGRCCRHSSRERVWRCAPFSRGAFFCSTDFSLCGFNL